MRIKAAPGAPERREPSRAKGKNTPATGPEIYDIIQISNYNVIFDILQTGASYDQISDACKWLEEDKHTLPTRMRKMDEKTRRVYEILDYYDKFL